MNLQKLKFAIEIEKTSSITKAAKNLFMSQPNLSKSIKELESEIGIEIFNRTSKGAEPTQEGLHFLSQAKNIIKQIEILEEMYSPTKDESFSFKVSVPRTTYLTGAFSNFMNLLNIEDKTINVQYRETSNENTIESICNKNCDLGIIRYQKMYESYFLNLIKESDLQCELLWSYKMKLIMSASHPLANEDEVPYEKLKNYVEVIHGDLQIPNISKEYDSSVIENIKPKNRIYVYDRGSQYDFLQQIKGSYKWASPVVKDELDKYNLVQKNCNLADINIDMLVYKNKKSLKTYQKQFIEAVKNVIEKNYGDFKEV